PVSRSVLGLRSARLPPRPAVRSTDGTDSAGVFPYRRHMGMVARGAALDAVLSDIDLAGVVVHLRAALLRGSPLCTARPVIIGATDAPAAGAHEARYNR